MDLYRLWLFRFKKNDTNPIQTIIQIHTNYYTNPYKRLYKSHTNDYTNPIQTIIQIPYKRLYKSKPSKRNEKRNEKRETNSLDVSLVGCRVESF